MLLSLAVAPGEGLGPFRLGQTLPDVLKHLRAHRSEYRCVEIKQATPTQVGFEPATLLLILRAA